MSPFLAFLLPAALLATPLPALAEPKADVRLLLGGVDGGRVVAGLAVDLPEGWKTYWRMPGDAGIPPMIDAGASTGVGLVAVRYPAPERFDEAGLTAVGYTRSVVLPLDVALADPKRPGHLSVSVMIGLCHDVCVPFETKLEADVGPAMPADAAAKTMIETAAARVPRPAEAGRAPEVAAVRRETTAKGTRLVAEVAMPAGSGPHDVFVEGPTAEWALPQPEKTGLADGRELWTFAVDGTPKGADLSAVDLRFTLTAGATAVEQVVRVDAGAGAP